MSVSVPYLDHNATAPLLPEVAEFLSRAYAALTANPSSVHRPGQEARTRLDRARAQVAEVLGVSSKEIVFTASGTESNALAIKGAYAARAERTRTRIVTSTIEHPSVLLAVEQLEREGAPVTRIAPARSGRIDPAAMIAALSDDVLLCSLMWANNETGVVQPVKAVAQVCRERGILFHSDGVQAVGKVPVTPREVDLLSLSAHKFGGPAGVGVLFVRREVEVASLSPGHQEGGRRGGTQALVAIEAAALALRLAHAHLESTATRVAALRDRFERAVLERFPGARVNGEGERVPNTSNVCFSRHDGEALLIALDLEDVTASAGAACASGTMKPSHVLLAMGLDEMETRSSLRFSFGPSTSDADIEAALGALGRQLRLAARPGAQLASTASSDE